MARCSAMIVLHHVNHLITSHHSFKTHIRYYRDYLVSIVGTMLWYCTRHPHSLTTVHSLFTKPSNLAIDCAIDRKSSFQKLVQLAIIDKTNAHLVVRSGRSKLPLISPTSIPCIQGVYFYFFLFFFTLLFSSFFMLVFQQYRV